MTEFGKDYSEEAKNDFNLWRNAVHQVVKKEEVAAHQVVKKVKAPATKTSETILVEGAVLKGAIFPDDMKERILDYKTRKSAEGGNFKFRLIDLFNKGGVELRKDMGVVIEEREYSLEMSLTDNPVPEGGTSTTLTALDQTSYELRDIKFLLPSSKRAEASDTKKAMANCFQEIYVLSVLDHPNIGKVHGLVLAPRFGIVTDYQHTAENDAFTLEELMSVESHFSIEEIIAVLQPVASALRAAHNDHNDKDVYDKRLNTVVHRDINPANILLLPDGHLIVKNFDHAKLLVDPQTMEVGGMQTQVTAIPEYPAYISPEQAGGTNSLRLKPATDIYSLSVVAYSMAARRQPYDGTEVDIIQQVLKGKHNGGFPSIFDVAKGEPTLLKLIDAGMEYSPSQRLPSSKGNIGGAAKYDEDLKDITVYSGLNNLMNNGAYSADAAQGTRKSLLNRLKPILEANR